MVELLSLERVSKSFGGVAALRDFSLSVSEGERVGLLGPNGAGKTTLFNLISGFLRADSGTVLFRGTQLNGLGPHRSTALGISRTFQITRPFPRLTVFENVVAGAVFGSGAPMRRAGEMSHELLGLVSLQGKAHLPAGSLTLAEQRRLELARALATSPRLLLLDEVMAGLTPVERASMVALLIRVSEEKGIAVIASEHLVGSLARLCERLVVMDRGVKRGEGVAGTILGSDLEAEVYRGGARLSGRS